MKFRKLPVEIDAVRWDDDLRNRDEIEAFVGDCLVRCEKCNGYGEYEEEYGPKACMPCTAGCLRIQTLEGRTWADPGDWIIKGIKGEFYPCKPDIFEATYEAIE